MKLIIAGDFCPKNRVTELIDKGNYESVLGEIKEYISQADYSIVNLEAPVVESKATPIEKCGPNLKCTSKAVKALKWAGFNMATLANNHFYDYGDNGVKETLDACQKEGITTVGGGMNIHEASQTAYLNVKGLRIGIINCCEHEFSIATENSGGANPLNPIQQYYAIQEAKKNADRALVIVHGGHEYYQLPSPRMQETYRFWVDAGADFVVNHHQHCYSGYEIYNGKPIFYGLGNFSFDWDGKRNSTWNEGYMVQISIDKDSFGFELIPYIQGNDKAGIEIIQDKNSFFASISKLNAIISDSVKLEDEHKKFMSHSSMNYLLAFEPYENKYLNALYRRGLLFSCITNKKKLQLLNYLKCEAHLERAIYSLSTKNN